MSATRPQLHLVDTQTGEVVQDERDDLIDQLTRDLHGKQIQIAQMRKELRHLRSVEPEAETIRDVLDYWRERCKPKAEIAPGGKRWEKVRARLSDKLDGRDPWTPDELKRAVDGALLDPWLSGRDRKSKGYLDAETIFRDAEMVERLRNLALGFEAKAGVGIDELLEIGDQLQIVSWRHVLKPCECGHRRIEHSKPDPHRFGNEPCFLCDCEDFAEDDLAKFKKDWGL